MSTAIEKQLARFHYMQRTSRAVYAAMHAAARSHPYAEEARYLACLAQRIATCHRTTRAVVHRPRDDVHWIQVKQPFGCMSPWCMLCARNKAKRLRRHLDQVLLRIWCSHPTMRGSLLTLTSRNATVAHAQDMLDHHTDSMDRYGRRQEVQRSNYGALIGIELPVRNNGTEIGVHSHHLQLVDDACMGPGHYLRIERITELWRDSLRVDYLPLCHIQAIKPVGDDMLDAMASAVRETAKYCLKPLSLVTKESGDLLANPASAPLFVDPEVVRHVALAIRNRRLVRLTGLWKSTAREFNAITRSTGARRSHPIPPA